MNKNEFKLVEASPTPALIRIYVQQLLEAPFGFADEIRQSVQEKAISIAEADVSVLFTLVEDYLPEVFYFFPHKYKGDKHPFLYTAILDVSIEQSGLLVLQCFGSQISVLCNSNGDELLDFCHDLELGPNGLVVWRGSDNSSFWNCDIYNGIKGSWSNVYFPYGPPELFSDLQLLGRDKLKVSHNPKDLMIAYSDHSLSPIERNFQAAKGSVGDFEPLLNDETSEVWLTAPWFIDFYDIYRLALRAVQRDFRVFTLLKQEFKHEPTIINAFLMDAPFQLILASNFLYGLNLALWVNRSLIKKWITECRYAYGLMPEDLKRDKELLFEFIGHTSSFEAIPEDLLENRSLMLEGLKVNGSLLSVLSTEFRNDAELVLIAVKNKGIALKYASDALKDNYEIVSNALKSDGWALQFASMAMRNNKSLVKLAVEKSGATLQFAGQMLQSDATLISLIETRLPEENDLPF